MFPILHSTLHNRPVYMPHTARFLCVKFKQKEPCILSTSHVIFKQTNKQTNKQTTNETCKMRATTLVEHSFRQKNRYEAEI